MRLMKKVAVMNKTQLIMVNVNAFFGVIIPFGISRMAVRGLSASQRRSKKRLKAMAALRAVIMQMSTKPNRARISEDEEGMLSGDMPEG